MSSLFGDTAVILIMAVLALGLGARTQPGTNPEPGTSEPRNR